MAIFRHHKRVFKSLLLVSGFLLLAFQTASFKDSQIKYKRVKTAYEKKWSDLQALLREKGVSTENFELLINCYKMEKQLEIWCRSSGSQKYVLIKTIPICATSGALGPKRKEGDGQVPEGFYEVSWFNPMSDYHLGLKINYPNSSDRIKAKGNRPGGDIMIHGYCVTIGCIPLQNEPIEELYVLCVESKNKKHSIPVNIYPFRMNAENINSIIPKVDQERAAFWNNIKDGYTYFETHSSMPGISVGKEGDYKIVQ